MIKIIIRSLFCYLFICGQTIALAQNAAILPQGKTQFLDNNGNPLSSGTVDFYIPSTTTRKTTWQDAAKTIPNSNPVVLDAGGRAIIYGDGTYRQIVKTSTATTIFDAVTASAGSGGGTTGTGDGDLVATVKSWAGLVAPNQYVFAYGQEISRTTYAAFYTAVTLNQNVNCTSGNPTLTGLSDTSQIPNGAVIETTCIAAGSTVLSKTSTTVTMSSNASLTTATTGIFFLYGNGNGSTTFNVPDLRGYVIAGRCNMGGTDCTTLTATGLGATASATGAKGGGQTKTLLTVNLPPYTPTGTTAVVPVGVISTPTITTTLSAASTNVVNNGAGGSANLTGGGGALLQATITASSNSSTPIFSGIASNGSFTGIPQGGTSTPFGIVQSTQTLNYIIKIIPDQNSANASGVTSLGLMVGDIACGTGLLCTGNIISLAPTVTAPTITVATNSALKGLGAGLYSWATRTGYYANGDSPATTYYWNGGSSCIDDGGSCIAPSVGSGRWILVKPANTVSASIFGATCPSTGNDQPFIQAAINYAQTAYPAGGTVKISGNCFISSELVITSNVTLKGDAMDSTFFYPSSTTNSCINFNPSGPFKTLNLFDFTCSYASINLSGAIGIQYGNSTYNNIGGVIQRINCTNCNTGVSMLNTLNMVFANNQISPFCNAGLIISDPLAPDSGGFQIYDNFIQVFAPVGGCGAVGIQWFSGGALDIHNNEIFGQYGVWLLMSLQTSELQVTNNLFAAAGVSTAAVQISTNSATFTCSQSGTNLTVTGVTGILVPSTSGGGQTVLGTGVVAGTNLVSQTSGTPGGAGVYVTNIAGTAAAAACRSTFIFTETQVNGNIFDGWERALYVPVNTGGEFVYNLNFNNNLMSSKNNAAQNQLTVNNTLGLTVSNNMFKCNGNCVGGRAILIGSTVDKATIWQPTSSKIGSWGATDSVTSTNTCGMLGNALVTTC